MSMVLTVVLEMELKELYLGGTQVLIPSTVGHFLGT